jgi:TonB C terminal
VTLPFPIPLTLKPLSERCRLLTITGGFVRDYSDSRVYMRLLILFFCCAFAYGQDAAPANTSKQKPAHQYGLGLGTIGRTVEGVEILSNTSGVELAPYLRVVVQNINRNWHDQIPASWTRKGKLAIEFAIKKDGKLADMSLVSRPGGPDDEALVRMAWTSITKSNPFPSLPSGFTGSFLALRFHFDYSKDDPNKR